MRQVTAKELAEAAYKLERNQRLEFHEEYNEETKETTGAYGLICLKFFDAKMILINYYGGGYPFLIDIEWDSDSNQIIEAMEKYFKGTGFKTVWLEEESDKKKAEDDLKDNKTWCVSVDLVFKAATEEKAEEMAENALSLIPMPENPDYYAINYTDQI